MADMTTTVEASRDATAWHGLTADQACAQLEVEERSGLDAGEVERRRAQFGPNKLEEAEKEPGWRAFLRQYRDLMQLVLLGAAIVRHGRAPGVRYRPRHHRLTVLNAVLGLNQEGKAAESVAALQKMLVIRAHVRRGGSLATSPQRSSCRGIVVFEAGDKIPADGRLLVAATMEIEEAALTGESTPVREGGRPRSGRGRPAWRPARHESA